MARGGGRPGAAAGEAVEVIRQDHEHGASFLARRAARLLADSLMAPQRTPTAPTASDIAEARALARELALARPSMAAVAMTLARVWWAAEVAGAEERPVEAAEALRREASEVEVEWAGASAAIAAKLRPFVTPVVLTLSRSGSVEESLSRIAVERMAAEPLRVVVLESRPGGEGVALARALGAAGAQVTVIADAAIASVIDTVGAVVVGADSVRPDGSLVNKVGTHTVALVARDAGKPVFVACERLKVTAASFPLSLEEMDPRELLAEPAKGVVARNPYFDVTPPDLIAGVITEDGLLLEDQRVALATVAEERYQALMRR